MIYELQGKAADALQSQETLQKLTESEACISYNLPSPLSVLSQRSKYLGLL